MKILTRHVLSEFLKVFGICLLSMLGIYYIVDIFNYIEIFINFNAPLWLKFSYFLYKLPLIIYQVVPVCLLVTVVTVIGIMARNNELTAVKAGGYTLYALTFPLMAAALAISLLVWVNNEYLLPSMSERAITILDVKIKGKPPRGIFRQNRIWYMGQGNVVWKMDVLDPAQRRLEGVTLVRFDDSFRPLERIDAVAMLPRPEGGWELQQVVRRTFSDGGTRISAVDQQVRLVLPLPEKLEDFVKYKRNPNEMNFGELQRYVERLTAAGYNATPYRTDLFAKTAIPFISLVISFMSVALAVRGSTRGGIVASIGLCLAVGVAYWLVLSVGLSLGHAGRLPPLMASWGANIIFGAAGLFFYANLRQ